MAISPQYISWASDSVLTTASYRTQGAAQICLSEWCGHPSFLIIRVCMAYLGLSFTFPVPMSLWSVKTAYMLGFGLLSCYMFTIYPICSLPFFSLISGRRLYYLSFAFFFCILFYLHSFSSLFIIYRDCCRVYNVTLYLITFHLWVMLSFRV